MSTMIPLSPHAALLAMHDGIEAGLNDHAIVASILAREADAPLRVWDITLTCDHKMLVVAPTPGAALACAQIEASTHGVLPEGQPAEVNLDNAGLLVWYPGPWSVDAIPETEGERWAGPTDATMPGSYGRCPCSNTHPQFSG